MFQRYRTERELAAFKADPMWFGIRKLQDSEFGGFDYARERGLLGSYMEMMNRGGSGGYDRRWITAAKMRPGVDPLSKARLA